MKINEELLNKARELNGKTLRIVNITPEKSSKINKGNFGNIIQEYYFGLAANNRPEPDFLKQYGTPLELKVTPLIRRGNNKLVSKERMVLGMINFSYMTEDIYQSSFYQKDCQILIMFYEYKKDQEKLDYQILNSYIWDFDKINHKDQQRIIKDYQIIYNKVRMGFAHELSSSDTEILEACRKGSGKGRDEVLQPFSTIKTPSRAFAFKNSYMTKFWNDNEKTNSFDEYIRKNINDVVKFLNSKKGTDLNLYNDKNSKSKSKNHNLILKLIHEYENYDQFKELLDDKNVTLRTMKLKNNSNLVQESYPVNTKYILREEIISKEEFIDSEFYEDLNKPVILVTLNESNNQVLITDVIFISSFVEDEKYYDNAKKVWDNTKEKFIRLKETNSKNPFITLKNNLDFHVRPKAKNGAVTYDGTMITRRSFWVNKQYINKIIGASREQK